MALYVIYGLLKIMSCSEEGVCQKGIMHDERGGGRVVQQKLFAAP